MASRRHKELMVYRRERDFLRVRNRFSRVLFPVFNSAHHSAVIISERRCQRGFWLYRDAIAQAMVSSFTETTVPARLIINGSAHCRNMGRAFWHLPWHRTISFHVRAHLPRIPYLPATMLRVATVSQVPRRTTSSTNERSGARAGQHSY